MPEYEAVAKSPSEEGKLKSILHTIEYLWYNRRGKRGDTPHGHGGEEKPAYGMVAHGGGAVGVDKNESRGKKQ